MPSKSKGSDLITEERRLQTKAYLTAIGEEANESSKGVTETNLTDSLIKLLNKKTRKALAEKLIDLALVGADRTSLEAIREIYDRIEGRARVSVPTARAETDPLLKLLGEVMAQEPTLIAGGKRGLIIEAETRVLDE